MKYYCEATNEIKGSRGFRPFVALSNCFIFNGRVKLDSCFFEPTIEEIYLGQLSSDCGEILAKSAVWWCDIFLGDMVLNKGHAPVKRAKIGTYDGFLFIEPWFGACETY